MAVAAGAVISGEDHTVNYANGYITPDNNIQYSG